MLQVKMIKRTVIFSIKGATVPKKVCNYQECIRLQ